MRNGKDVYAYGAELRRIVRFLGISDGNMAEGSMRCDVNISVRRWGHCSSHGGRVMCSHSTPRPTRPRVLLWVYSC